jgi:glucose-1-phosphate cytidylyltransferase
MKKYNYPVVILAGGQGTRLREETEFRPKPMLTIGGHPILWHIMKLYSSFGFYRFIICLGYKGEMIKNYFLNYRLENIDFTINTKTGKTLEHQDNPEEWEVTLVDTGEKCYTGGRVARIEKYIDTDRFLLTYGDGLADVNIQKLLEFHINHKKIGTLTGINPPSRFGNLKLDESKVVDFVEKQKLNNGWINGGFFVLEKDFFKYLSTDPTCVLEKTPLQKLSSDKELMLYKHNGFWQCMDTIGEYKLLETLWNTTAPWKTWDNSNEIKNI